MSDLDRFDGTSDFASRDRRSTTTLGFAGSTTAAVTVTFADQFPTGVVPVVTVTPIGDDPRVITTVDAVSNVAFVLHGSFPTTLTANVVCGWTAGIPTQ